MDKTALYSRLRLSNVWLLSLIRSHAYEGGRTDPFFLSFFPSSFFFTGRHHRVICLYLAVMGRFENALLAHPTAPGPTRQQSVQREGGKRPLHLRVSDGQDDFGNNISPFQHRPTDRPSSSLPSFPPSLPHCTPKGGLSSSPPLWIWYGCRRESAVEADRR